MKIRIKRLLSRVRRREPAPRSLVFALKDLIPPRVLRDVIEHTRDRRHMGSLAAAWIGITELELMRAVAQKLALPFFSTLSIEKTLAEMVRQPDLLEDLERCGAVLVDSTGDVPMVACVDPTELRSLTALDISQVPVAISTWPMIRAALDRASATAVEEDAERFEVEQHKEEALALEAIHLIFTEIIPYNVKSADLFLGDQRPRYQFLLENGKRGVGVLHAKVAPILDRYLSRVNRVERPFSINGSIGSLRIAVVSEGSVYRLIWSPVSRRLEAPVPALPAPTQDRLPPPLDEVISTTVQKCEEVAQELHAVPAATTGRPRVLVADDNSMFARILEKYLAKHGFLSILVSDGQEALKWLQSSEDLPACVVTDLHMPNANGKELIAAIRANERLSGLKVVVLTSDEDAEAEIQLLGIGADAFVTKSKDPRVLCSHVVRLTGISASREAA